MIFLPFLIKVHELGHIIRQGDSTHLTGRVCLSLNKHSWLQLLVSMLKTKCEQNQNFIIIFITSIQFCLLTQNGSLHLLLLLLWGGNTQTRCFWPRKRKSEGELNISHRKMQSNVKGQWETNIPAMYYHKFTSNSIQSSLSTLVYSGALTLTISLRVPFICDT